MGVDPQSWIGFEHRIQERRFRALLETIAAASARGDGVGARIALEEARELRPDAPELTEAEHLVALLPMAMPAVPPAGYFHSRTVGAFALLLVGVALLLALDFVRPSDPAATTTAVVAPAAAPVAAPAVTLQPVETSAVDVFDAAPVEQEEPAPEEPVVTVPVVMQPKPLPAIGTAGARTLSARPPERDPQPPSRERLIERPIVPTVTLAAVPDEVSPAGGEIPDDFVAPQTRREAIVASPLVSRDSRGPLLVRPPVDTAEASAASVTGAAGPGASPPPAASAAVAPVRRDETLVSSVLDRYARAYDALDASAAREIWPSVDERALARAFAGLQSQSVSFDDCNIDVRGETAAASCRGLASYVGKVGSREPRTEPRQWTFELRRDGEAWKIESARTSLRQ
jgi:hypothetical protein